MTRARSGPAPPPVKVTLLSDPLAFLQASQGFISADPWSSNVVAGVAERIAAGLEPGSGDDLFITVGEAAAVVGVAMHTPPHALFLSRMPEAAADRLALTLAQGGRQLPGVSGARDATSAFASSWLRLTGRRSRLVTSLRLYRLHQLVPPRGIAGQPARAGAPQDIGLISRWMEEFHDEAALESPSQDWGRAAARRVGAGEVQVWWQGGQPVAMACSTRTAAGVARLGPVYTPPRFRRRGYGTAVTAAAVEAVVLAGAREVVLYTDLANPTSNSIYLALGFRPEHDAQELQFT